MDYEEKYKQALETVQEILSSGADAIRIKRLKLRLQSVFPELAESEDERIRKGLIKAVSFMLKGGVLKDTDVTREEALAWLEKQGEKKHIINVPPREVILSIWDLGNEWKELTNGCISTEYGTQLDYIQKHWHESEYYLKEKQGEQKPILDFKASDWYVSKVDGKIHNTYHSVDKVEPKFKVYDWITGIDDEGEASTYRIVEFWGDKVRLVDLDEHFTLYPKSELNNYHLWTINDAKDGDLIYVSTETKGLHAIFHKFENGIIYFHCNLCSDFAQGGYEPSGDVKSVNPLLKEHYRRFFQKMKQAGYEWDAEKKVLSKRDIENYDATRNYGIHRSGTNGFEIAQGICREVLANTKIS